LCHGSVEEFFWKVSGISAHAIGVAMRLALINNEGEVYEITDEIEAYDLDKPMARANICNEIQEALEKFKDAE
jgi:hypothetical protein